MHIHGIQQSRGVFPLAESQDTFIQLVFFEQRNECVIIAGCAMTHKQKTAPRKLGLYDARHR